MPTLIAMQNGIETETQGNFPIISTGTLMSIQSLRALAAISVVLFHSYQLFSPSYVVADFADEAYLFGFGAAGVHIFFVISEYIMYRSSFASGKAFDSKTFYLDTF